MFFLARIVSNNIYHSTSHLKRRILFVMPKNRNYIPGLQKNRLKIREKMSTNSYGGAAQSYLQFVGCGAKGAPRSLYLFTDKNRYMFNVGEGTQRLAHEHKVKITRMEHLFITYPIWENIGGLPGMALTLQECGVPDLTLHGPQGVAAIFPATERFVILHNLNIKDSTSDDEHTFDDGIITVQHVPLKTSRPRRSRFTNDQNLTDFVADIEAIKDDIDYYSHLKQNSKRRESSLTLSDHLCTAVNPASLQTSIAYICRLTPKLGFLNLEKCVRKNVPPGPLLGKLKNGEDITLADGTVVKACDVKDPDEPGPVFIIVECPEVEFLDSLLNEKAFVKYQKITDVQDIPFYVIHFTPSGIMNDERYQIWMKRFPEKTLHVNANDENKCLGCVGAHEIQYRLNLLDPQMFPLLNDDSIPKVRLHVPEDDLDVFERAQQRAAGAVPPASTVSRKDLNFPDHLGNTLRIMGLRPSDPDIFKISDCVYIDPASVIDEVVKLGVDNEVKELKTRLESLSVVMEEINKKWPYPIITFLGTGSCIPNKCRNTSGILVSLSSDNHMIMDCGEGTYGQLVRHFGYDRAQEILANTNITFISHLHADHHIGLISLLKNRRKAVKKFGSAVQQMRLVAPKTILFWLSHYQRLFEEIFDCVVLVPCHDLEFRGQVNSSLEKLLSVAPLQRITTSYVHHCAYSYGVSFVHLNGCKVTYSGDCTPSNDLIHIGKKSNLLIHEATFEDELDQEAKAKLHSTTSEAIEVGKKMSAEYVILTHFSQRYAKIPVLNDSFTENVGVAFDNMRVLMKDLPKLHLMIPALKTIFQEENEDMRTKSLKRKRSVF